RATSRLFEWRHSVLNNDGRAPRGRQLSIGARVGRHAAARPLTLAVRFSGTTRVTDQAPLRSLADSSVRTVGGASTGAAAYSPIPDTGVPDAKVSDVDRAARPRGAALRAARAGRSDQSGERKRQAARRMAGPLRSWSSRCPRAHARRSQLRDDGQGLPLHQRSGGDLLQPEGHGKRRVSRGGHVLTAQERDARSVRHLHRREESPGLYADLYVFRDQTVLVEVWNAGRADG